MPRPQQATRFSTARVLYQGMAQQIKRNRRNNLPQAWGMKSSHNLCRTGLKVGRVAAAALAAFKATPTMV